MRTPFGKFEGMRVEDLRRQPPDLDDARAYLRSAQAFINDALNSPNPFVLIDALEMIGQQAPLIDELLGRRPRRVA